MGSVVGFEGMRVGGCGRDSLEMGVRPGGGGAMMLCRPAADGGQSREDEMKKT